MLSGAAWRFIEVIVLADGVALVSGPLGSPPHGNERSDTLLFYQGAADLWLLENSNPDARRRWAAFCREGSALKIQCSLQQSCSHFPMP